MIFDTSDSIHSWNWDLSTEYATLTNSIMPLLLFLLLFLPNTGVTITVYAEQYLACPFLNQAHLILEHDLAITDDLISFCVSIAIGIYSNTGQEYPSLYHMLS